MPPRETGRRIDAAAVGLFRRGYCGIELDNPQEAGFVRRFDDPDSPESRQLRAAVDFTLKYPATY